MQAQHENDRIFELKVKLVQIIHAAKCCYGECCVIPGCQSIKHSIAMIVSEQEINVNDNDTRLVKQLIVHWNNCEESGCSVCAEVKNIKD